MDGVRWAGEGHPMSGDFLRNRPNMRVALYRRPNEWAETAMATWASVVCDPPTNTVFFSVPEIAEQDDPTAILRRGTDVLPLGHAATPLVGVWRRRFGLGAVGALARSAARLAAVISDRRR